MERFSRNLIIQNSVSMLEGFIPPKVYALLDKSMSYPVPNFFFTKAFKEKKWDGQYRLFNKFSHKFFTGLVSHVIQALDTYDLPYDILDQRIKPQRIFDYSLSGVTLRDYQEDIIEKSYVITRGIIEAATGAGKSLIIVGQVLKFGVSAAIFVNSHDLLYQMIDNFKDYTDIPESEIGQIGDGVLNIKKINIVMIQTVSSALGIKYKALDDEEKPFKEAELSNTKKEVVKKYLQEVGCIIFDEAHHLAAETFQNIARECTSAYYRWGLSASPWRDDGLDLLLYAHTGRKISKINASKLIPEYLVAPEISFIKMPVDKKISFDFLDYKTIYSRFIVENEYRNEVIVHYAQEFISQGHLTLVLVQRIEHGNILIPLLKEAIPWESFIEPITTKKTKRKIPVDEILFYHGKLAKTKRQAYLQAFKSQKVKIMVATQVADEGLDVPPLSAIILGGGGKSSTRALQRVGRGLRKFPGKEETYVIDFMETAKYLKQHSEARLKIYREEKKFKINLF